MLNETVPDSGVNRTNHRHRLPNLHKKLAESSPVPVATNTSDTSVKPGWFRMMMLICILLSGLAGGVFLIAKHAGDEIARAGHTIDLDVKQVIISSNVVAAPANMIRYPSQRYLAETKQLDLYMHWPKLEGYSEALKRDFNDTNDNSKIIFVTLSPRYSTFDMSARIDPIYRKFFVSTPEEIGNGLVSHQLDSNAGFIDEYLIVEKNNPYPFSARCIKKETSVATPFCIRDFHIGNGLSLSYRFHADLIPDWLALERSIRNKFKAMIS